MSLVWVPISFIYHVEKPLSSDIHSDFAYDRYQQLYSNIIGQFAKRVLYNNVVVLKDLKVGIIQLMDIIISIEVGNQQLNQWLEQKDAFLLPEGYQA